MDSQNGQRRVEVNTDLGINVSDSVKSSERFGSPAQLPGIAATLKVGSAEDLIRIAKSAEEISKGSKKAVVIVLQG